MSWSEIEKRWGDMIEAMLMRWPAMNKAVLVSIAADRVALADELARAHDLTRREAEEVLEDWRLSARSGR